MYDLVSSTERSKKILECYPETHQTIMHIFWENIFWENIRCCVEQICKRWLNFFLPPTHLVVNMEKLESNSWKKFAEVFQLIFLKTVNCTQLMGISICSVLIQEIQQKKQWSQYFDWKSFCQRNFSWGFPPCWICKMQPWWTFYGECASPLSTLE